MQFTDLYEAHPVETFLASLQESRDAILKDYASAVTEIRNARISYGAWPHYNEHGFPIIQPYDESENTKSIIYRNVNRFLGFGLGFSFEARDISQATLQEITPDETAYLANKIKKWSAQQIQRRMVPDYSELTALQTAANEIRDQATDAYFKLRDTSDKRLEKELVIFNNLIDKTKRLIEEFDAYPAMERVVYLWRGVLPQSVDFRNYFYCGSSLSIELSPEIQHERQSNIRRNYASKEQNEWTKLAKSDPIYWERIQDCMRFTRTGDYLLASNQKNPIDVLFVDLPEDSLERSGAIYDIRVKKIQIARKPSSSIEEISDKAAHEYKHGQQDREFPELFAEDLNIIDKYVAMKLRENEAWSTADMHVIERLIKTGASYPSIELEFGNQKIPFSDQEVFDVFQINQDQNRSSRVKVWTPYQMNFLIQFFERLSKNPTWADYEDSFQNPEMISIIKSGEFEKKVAASPFLQPEFLQRFCVAPDGESFLTADPKPLMAEIVKAVATLHHPYLAALAREARENRDVQIPIRESVPAPNSLEAPKTPSL